MADAQHTDGTPCPGARCAWAGDAGHRPAPIKPPRNRCPQCGQTEYLYDLDRVTMMQRFTIESDGSKAYNDGADDAGDTPVTIGIVCRSCDWTVEWGEGAGKYLSPDDLLLTESEFAASEQRDEDAKIAAARLEALRLMKGF